MEHIVEAVKWAKSKRKTLKRHKISYNQANFTEKDSDCGTRCCIWGAAFLVATGKTTNEGPSETWTNKSVRNSLLEKMFGATSEGGGDLCKNDTGDLNFLNTIEALAKAKL